MENPNFFADTFQKEIFDHEWYGHDDEDTGAFMIVVEVLFYNQNVNIMAKKSFVVEFLEAGPFINIEH